MLVSCLTAFRRVHWTLAIPFQADQAMRELTGYFALSPVREQPSDGKQKDTRQGAERSEVFHGKASWEERQ